MCSGQTKSGTTIATERANVTKIRDRQPTPGKKLGLRANQGSDHGIDTKDESLPQIGTKLQHAFDPSESSWPPLTMDSRCLRGVTGASLASLIGTKYLVEGNVRRWRRRLWGDGERVSHLNSLDKSTPPSLYTRSYEVVQCSPLTAQTAHRCIAAREVSGFFGDENIKSAICGGDETASREKGVHAAMS
ncbi:hypothetical protein EVAR_43453_1 [Eumeta japonica]|uniref:Uncharacterized protein n=1 Tax=Eumeta variegata TaxID=151549 RepID=A0A4C1YE47_EUMVA|nr:hypothetical protein EVAR_43453_1 [Eumeta japonica]